MEAICGSPGTGVGVVTMRMSAARSVALVTSPMAASASAALKRPRRPFSAQPKESTTPSAVSSSTWSAPEDMAVTRSPGEAGSKSSAGLRCTRTLSLNPARASNVRAERDA